MAPSDIADQCLNEVWDTGGWSSAKQAPELNSAPEGQSPKVVFKRANLLHTQLEHNFSNYI